MKTSPTPDETPAAPGPACTVSPHGAVAEAEDEWVADRWAPHGDLNEPADSDALNHSPAEQARGIRGDSAAAVRKAAKANR